MRRALPLLIVLLVGCSTQEKPKAPGKPAQDATAIDVSSGQVSGSLAGRDFKLREARYRLRHRPAHAYTDLVLSAGSLDQCGIPTRHDSPRVWLRFPGESLPPGDHVGGPDGPFTAHYEVPRADGEDYLAAAASSAKVSLVVGKKGRITARMAACFDDGWGSCVSGAFEALPCHSRLQGQMLREGPGLRAEPKDDEAVHAPPPPEPPTPTDDLPTEEPVAEEALAPEERAQGEAPP